MWKELLLFKDDVTVRQRICSAHIQKGGKRRMWSHRCHSRSPHLMLSPCCHWWLKSCWRWYSFHFWGGQICVSNHFGWLLIHTHWAINLLEPLTNWGLNPSSTLPVSWLYYQTAVWLDTLDLMIHVGRWTHNLLISKKSSVFGSPGTSEISNQALSVMFRMFLKASLSV